MDFQPQRKGRGLIINVTSLIDVMFLLLIFFMVSSTFKNQPAINIVLPRAATATDTPVTPTVLYLTREGDIYVNDAQVTREELPAVLRRLQAETGQDAIVLRGDAHVEYGDAIGLVDVLRQNGFTRLNISVRAAGQ
ncbi:hypothetical protein COW53_09435 [bacterium CG17_big_fil_post_rev_8_21_14_2_50_64_8]|nr:MAG: hypothetical protein COW53_09435 [bacterium CG17_big_fil_post_rev_8_21_14_2_50_64_8]PJA73491.1 MAG: hypothetical protein CO151_13325 [bacterium CG_4_9_14_3_um_filter_65_15]